MRLTLDRSARRRDGGRVLVAGSPLTVFRLGPAGRRVVDAIAAGDDVPPEARPLVDRLVDTGAAHPHWPGTRHRAADVTAVIPVHGHDPGSAVSTIGPVAGMLVVDDASDPPVAAPPAAPVEPAARPEVRVLRHRRNLGPAAARTTGLDAVTTPLVAFVDADCAPQPGWLEPLLRHFDDDRVALVAPRIVTRCSTADASRRDDVLVRYDTVRNPLDMGRREGRVAPTTRISYVPGAALLARVDALRDVGGFDPALRVGEDVDLVWRLVARGWRVRYEPAATVAHEPRRTLAAMARQRFDYGQSAAALHERHPGAVCPAIVGWWPASGWALAGCGHPLVGAALGLVPAIRLRRALPPMSGRNELAVELAALGAVRAGEQLASAVTRVWWPLALVAGVAVRRLRIPLAVAALLPALIDWVREPGGLDPFRYVLLRVVDDASYGAGVWAGAWRARDGGPLAPRTRPPSKLATPSRLTSPTNG